MLNNYCVGKLQSKNLEFFPNVDLLLKISIGLMLIISLSFVLAYAETASVNVEGNSFDVEYTTTGVIVHGIEADTDFVSLILTIDVTDSSGTLDIILDRMFFDSTFNGEDEDFFVLVDQDESKFTEIETTSQSRTLRIDLPAGSEDIEIIGSVFNTPVVIPLVPEPVEVIPEPVEVIPEPVEVIPEPVEVIPEPVEVIPEPVESLTLKTQCGPGTILQDGACVLDSTPQSTSTSVKGMGKELLIGVIAAFVVAGIIGIILGLMSKASKSKN